MDRFLLNNSKKAQKRKSTSQTLQTESAEGKKHKRVFTFVEHWKNGRPWLLHNAESNLMHCSYCQKHSTNPKNKFISGCESMRIENVRSHEESSEHKMSHSAFLNSNKALVDQPIVKAIISMEKGEVELMTKLFRTAFFIAKHERPYSEFSKLLELQASS